MKEFCNKNIKWIAIILFILLTFKSCQSCTRNSTIEYNKNNYEIVIDSLNNELINMSDIIKLQHDTIEMYKFQLSIMETNNKELKESNKYYQNTNRVLVNTNKNLTNKTEE